MRPGRVPSLPRGRRCPHGRVVCPPAACRFTAASPYPRPSNPPPRVHRYEASVEGSSCSPVRPSPRLWPPGGAGATWAFPELHTPSLSTTHVGVGTGTGHYPNYVTIKWPSCLRNCSHVRPRVAPRSGGSGPAPLSRLRRSPARWRSYPGALTERERTRTAPVPLATVERRTLNICGDPALHTTRQPTTYCPVMPPLTPLSRIRAVLSQGSLWGSCGGGWYRS